MNNVVGILITENELFFRFQYVEWSALKHERVFKLEIYAFAETTHRKYHGLNQGKSLIKFEINCNWQN